MSTKLRLRMAGRRKAQSPKQMTAEQRYVAMSSIRSKGTKPEQAVRRILRLLKEHHRSHIAALPGSPDFVLQERHVAIFVHGCFWHQHAGCRLARMPRSRPDYWPQKLRNNQLRDQRARRALRRLGWRVITVWECQTPDPQRLSDRLKALLCTA